MTDTYDNWFDDREDGEFTLPHVGDPEIIGLGDAYDDMRINVLTQAYVDLRKAYRYGLLLDADRAAKNDDDLGEKP